MTLSIVSNLVNYETSFQISSNSTVGLSENSLLKLYEIENEIKLAIKVIPININYTLGHIQKASKLVDSNFEKELLSLDPRVFNQIQSQISDLKTIVNTTLPMLVKGAQISEGLSHIVDLVQLFEVSKIENETKIPQTIPSFFYLLNNDILQSYNNSNVWLEDPTSKKNNTTTNNKSVSINNSKYNKTLDYQTAQGFSAGILEFIDNIIQIKSDELKNYNITKIKNEYSILNQLIENKSNIIKIEEFNKQNFKY